MTSLITILIALLGYGTPSDFSHMSEDELNYEIAQAEAAQTDSETGGGGIWDSPSHSDDPVDPDGDNTNP